MEIKANTINIYYPPSSIQEPIELETSFTPKDIFKIMVKNHIYLEDLVREMVLQDHLSPYDHKRILEILEERS